MITVSTSVRTGTGRAISPSGFEDARITVIVGYADGDGLLIELTPPGA
jgi:hypothetical protein